MATSRYGRVKLGIAAGTAASLLAGAAYLQMGATGAASSAVDLVQADLVVSVAESPAISAGTQSSVAVAATTSNPTSTSVATTSAVAAATTSATDTAARARTSRAS